MKRKIKKALDLLRFWLYNHIIGAFLRVDENKVVFLSEAHQNLDGNLKIMHDYIESLENQDYDIAVHVKGDRRKNESREEKRQIMKDLTTAKYIFLDDYYGLISSMKVREGQKLVQLWHGAGAYKKFGYSRLKTGDSLRSVHSGYRKYTNVTVTSEFIRPCYKEAFDVPLENVKATGIPRADMFFDKEKMALAKEKVVREYPEISGKKLVLIAPTYRGDKVEEANYGFEELGLSKLQESLGDEYKIMVRWHPALSTNINSGRVDFTLPDGVLDGCSYKDVNELLAATDILVTDYSSIIFEYLLVNKPIVFFAYDLDDYINNRGLYFDFDQYVYGKVAKNKEELARFIKEEDMVEDKREAFREKFMSGCNGHSTEEIYSWVFQGGK